MRRSYTIESGLAGLGDGERPFPNAAAIRAAIPVLSEVPSRMGADGLDGEGGTSIPVDVDTTIVTTARLYAMALETPIDWAPGIEDTRQQLAGQLGKVQEVGNVRQAAEQIDADLSDTDRYAGRLERAAQDEIVQVLRGMLSGTVGDLPQKDRDALFIDAREVLALVDSAQRGRADALARTREAKDALQEKTDDADAEVQMAEVMLALKHDRPVDDETLDKALTTYDALRGQA